MTKVLFVCSGNSKLGPNKVVANQAATLRKLNIEVEYFLIEGQGVSGYLKNVIPLLKKLKKDDSIDLLHSHYSLSAFVTTIALWFIKQPIPHIVSLMGSDTKHKGILSKSLRFCSKRFWDKTIVKSKSMIADIRLENCELIPNGVDICKIERIEKKITNQYCQHNNDRVILFVSNPNREVKNFELAQQALKLLKLDLRVVYNKSHEKILEEILKADILMLTSKWEGSPNIIKEAMACNRPAVATDVGDVRWLFGNEPGYFLTSFDPVDVAEKVKMALKFSKEKGRTNGRNRIRDLKLNSESIALRIYNIYNELNKN